MPVPSRDKHWNWKGEMANSSSKHTWINTHYGKANKCNNEFCDGKSKHYEWANLKNHKHTRKREDYKMMCRKCHSIFDKARYCKNGHKRNNKNTHIRSNGDRECLVCRKLTKDIYKPIRRIVRSEAWKMLKFLFLRVQLDRKCGKHA